MKNLIKNILIPIDGLFFKLFLYFVSLLIPTAIIGVVTYIYYANLLRIDFTNKININLASSAKTVDIYLRSVQKTSINFFKDEMIRNILVPGPGLTLEQHYQLLKIPPIITRNQNLVSEFVSNVFVYLDRNKIYSGDGIDDFNSFFGNFYNFNRYNTHFWSDLLKSDRNYLILPPSRVKSSNQVRPDIMNDTPFAANSSKFGVLI
jgi:two-component system response regulator YesN